MSVNYDLFSLNALLNLFPTTEHEVLVLGVGLLIGLSLGYGVGWSIGRDKGREER